MKSCIICGKSDDTKMNPLNMESPFFPDFVHSQCLITKQYQNWIEKHKNENAQYRRYWNLMTVGLPVECPQCKRRVGLFPKAIGMGAGNWEVNCSDCHNASYQGLSGYTHDLAYSQLEELREQYLIGKVEDIDTQNQKLANLYDSKLPWQKCDCGGHFSLAAKPRCIYCNAVLIDSYFHCAGTLDKLTC